MLCQNRPKILLYKGNTKTLVIFDCHIIRKSQICSLNKLTSKELYLILVDANAVKQAAQEMLFKFGKVISPR